MNRRGRRRSGTARRPLGFMKSNRRARRDAGWRGAALNLNQGAEIKRQIKFRETKIHLAAAAKSGRIPQRPIRNLAQPGKIPNGGAASSALQRG